MNCPFCNSTNYKLFESLTWSAAETEADWGVAEQKVYKSCLDCRARTGYYPSEEALKDFEAQNMNPFRRATWQMNLRQALVANAKFLEVNRYLDEPWAEGLKVPNWPVIYKRKKLLRKWWARTIGAKKSSPGNWPSWLPKPEVRIYTWWHSQLHVSIKYQIPYRDFYVIRDRRLCYNTYFGVI